MQSAKERGMRREIYKERERVVHNKNIFKPYIVATKKDLYN